MKRTIVASLVLAALLIACIMPVVAYAQEPLSEEAYATTIGDHASKVSEAMYTLSDLMANAEFGNDEWTLDVAVQLATIRVLYDEAMDIAPPNSMANIHYKYVQAMKHYETSTHLIAQGVDDLDVNLINQATTEILTGAQLMNEATKLTDEFLKGLTAEVTTPPPPTPPKPEEDEDEGCFIATAAYGTDTAQEIDILREFRDEILLPNSLGIEFVSSYYKNSPPIANFISKHEVLRTIVREGFVDPIVAILNWTRNLWSE